MIIVPVLLKLEELDLVKAEVENHLMVKTVAHVRELADLDNIDINDFIYPALIIVSVKLFNDKKKDIAVQYAVILQLIHIASKIHFNITESCAKPYPEALPKKGYQFPVLVGDYLYGKIFTLLNENGGLSYLELLSELICSINAGGILRNERAKLTDSLIKEIVYKEVGSFCSIATYIGALIADADDRHSKYMRDFGLNFGLGYGLLKWKVAKNNALLYIDKAKTILNMLEDVNLDAKRNLLTLADDVTLMVERT